MVSPSGRHSRHAVPPWVPSCLASLFWRYPPAHVSLPRSQLRRERQENIGGMSKLAAGTATVYNQNALQR